MQTRPSPSRGRGDRPTVQVYSLSILLPDSAERELRTWLERTPGGTLPTWGAHITLLNNFVPTRGLAAIEQAVAQVCAATRPFSIRLDEVVSGSHWKRPSLNAVVLVSSPRSPGRRALVQFQRELVAALAPLKRDLDPQVSRRPFNPHTSLTWGLPEASAAQLAEAARRARLEVEFTIDRVWLLAFAQGARVEHATRLKAFMLGANTRTPTPSHPSQPSHAPHAPHSPRGTRSRRPSHPHTPGKGDPRPPHEDTRNAH